MNSESERPRTSSRLLVFTASVHTQASSRRGRLPKGSYDCRHRPIMYERVGAVGALVLEAVAGVGAGQGAQHQHPRHEAEIGVRFAGRNKQVHLIGLGEVVPRLGRGLEGFHSAARTRSARASPIGNQARLVYAA